MITTPSSPIMTIIKICKISSYLKFLSCHMFHVLQCSAAGVRSPVEQNPYINIGSTTNKPLRLAINTAQFGRTFQDRSHVFILQERPDEFDGLTEQQTQRLTIHNLNVRGKRGNIVQTYPSVEYDFIPNKLQLDTSDAVHIQWTGEPQCWSPSLSLHPTVSQAQTHITMATPLEMDRQGMLEKEPEVTTNTTCNLTYSRIVLFELI